MQSGIKYIWTERHVRNFLISNVQDSQIIRAQNDQELFNLMNKSADILKSNLIIDFL